MTQKWMDLSLRENLRQMVVQERLGEEGKSLLDLIEKNNWPSNWMWIVVNESISSFN